MIGDVGLDEDSAWGSLDGALAPVATEAVSLQSLLSSFSVDLPPGETRRSTLRTYFWIQVDRWQPCFISTSGSLRLNSCLMSRKADLPTARASMTMSSLPPRALYLALFNATGC